MHDDLEHVCAMQGRGGPGSNKGNGRVVEQTWLFGVDCQVRQWTIHVTISWRHDQRTEGTLWCQSNRTSSTKINNPGDCHPWVARCFHGSWARSAYVVCAFRYSDHIPYCEGRRWTHCMSTCISTRVSPKNHVFRVERNDLVLGSKQEEDPDRRHIFRQYLLGHQRRIWGVRC